MPGAARPSFWSSAQIGARSGEAGMTSACSAPRILLQFQENVPPGFCREGPSLAPAHRWEQGKREGRGCARGDPRAVLSRHGRFMVAVLVLVPACLDA
jgi:hypothetical protein